MRGEFCVYETRKIGELVETGETPTIVPNQIVQEGGLAFLKMIFQHENLLVPGGSNFYAGLANQIPVDTDILSAISTEPTAAGGYARQPIVRSSAGWPTVSLVNGVPRVESATVNFSAVGADFSAAFNRLFICSVVSGTVGTLFSFSGPLTPARLVLTGETVPVKYRLYLD